VKRCLFTIFSAVSLLLFVATVVLWVRSYWVSDGVQGGGNRGSYWHARSDRGELHFLRPVFVHPPPLPDTFLYRRGFVWARHGSRLVVAVPHWFVTLVAATLPAAWLVRTRRGIRRRRLGLCPACGYDVRATPERWPECGAVSASGSHSAGVAKVER
jgi:hypothetical protein